LKREQSGKEVAVSSGGRAKVPIVVGRADYGPKLWGVSKEKVGSKAVTFR
jgi:hypothetical protein